MCPPHTPRPPHRSSPACTFQHTRETESTGQACTSCPYAQGTLLYCYALYAHYRQATPNHHPVAQQDSTPSHQPAAPTGLLPATAVPRSSPAAAPTSTYQRTQAVSVSAQQGAFSVAVGSRTGASDASGTPAFQAAVLARTDRESHGVLFTALLSTAQAALTRQDHSTFYKKKTTSP